MKCVMNVKTGRIIRETNETAHQLVANRTHQYTSKSEYRRQNTEAAVEAEKEERH